jgi:hypothetical protein
VQEENGILRLAGNTEKVRSHACGCFRSKVVMWLAFLT